MKLFKCTRCGQMIYFENSTCEQCGFPLGFLSEDLQLVPLTKTDYGSFTIYGRDATAYRYCSNHKHDVCNWLVRADYPGSFCRACELNRTIPNLSRLEYANRWKVLESAKHRLIYTLLRMKLPLTSKHKDPANGLFFDFLADGKKQGQKRVLTGHEMGVITINIAEADDIEREMARRAMDELYRTVLGHFRHEIGHYYWGRLIQNTSFHHAFRQFFGDELEDYSGALKQHYANGPKPGWNAKYISAYASVHPWEDWAESWAHYLHIIDTLETAYAFGLKMQPGIAESAGHFYAEMKTDPYEIQNFEVIMGLWLPLTFTMNSLNRSMGLPDPYPFVIRPAIMEKLKFIHEVCYHAAQDSTIAAEAVVNRN